MSRAEMEQRGWEELDVLLVTGDAYVDHPAFGTALIGRVLEAAGLRVGIVAQPDWKQAERVALLGRPRLFAGITAGAMDSMVANYTANRKIRRDDAYSPGGRAGNRPNMATIVYTNLVRQAFPGLPVILGGIEASLRRFVYYDYWKDKPRRSLLLDAKAELIVAGMGEKAILKIAERLQANPDVKEALQGIPGTVEKRPFREIPPAWHETPFRLPDGDTMIENRALFLQGTLQTEKLLSREGADPAIPRALQKQGDQAVIEWAPAPLTCAELDKFYDLPFQRQSHPSYKEKIPALEPVRFSITSHRGCFGGCAFCALGLHQGKTVLSRSPESILAEAAGLSRHPEFRGSITDVGGPTANMYGLFGKDPARCEKCERPSCLFPKICNNLETDHRPYQRLLEAVTELPGVKHLALSSGLRYDLFFDDKENWTPSGKTFLKQLVQNWVGGQLSVAPEHVDPKVLALMGKPPFGLYEKFENAFNQMCRETGNERFLIPYFIASYPGSTPEAMAEVERWLRKRGLRLRQIQDFLPGPMTVAGALYFTEKSPDGKKGLFVAKKGAERQKQREMLTRPDHKKSHRERPKGPPPKGRAAPRRDHKKFAKKGPISS